MSTETANKKIKIDNGTTFGRTYTDKAVDELLKNYKYKGYDNIVYDKTNCVRVSPLFTSNFDDEEMTLKLTDEVTLSASDASKVRGIILKAIQYGFVVEQVDSVTIISPLTQCVFVNDDTTTIVAYFGTEADNASSSSLPRFAYELMLDSQNKYYCKRNGM